MKFKLIFISRVLLFLLAFTGVTLEIVKYGWGMLMYYTVLSNLLVLLFLGYLLYLMVTGDSWKTPKLMRIKGGVTMSIMITCVVYHLLLAPIATDFYRLENFLCHYIVPLGFFFDTIFYDKSRQYRWLDPLFWTSVPLVYMVFALMNGLIFKVPIPEAKDSPFPYFFVNVPKYGWPYVMKMILIIFLAYLVSGYILYGIKSISRQKAPNIESL